MEKTTAQQIKDMIDQYPQLADADPIELAIAYAIIQEIINSN